MFYLTDSINGIWSYALGDIKNLNYQMQNEYAIYYGTNFDVGIIYYHTIMSQIKIISKVIKLKFNFEKFFTFSGILWFIKNMYLAVNYLGRKWRRF